MEITSREGSNTLSATSCVPNQATSYNYSARYYGPSNVSGGTILMGDNYGTINLSHDQAYTVQTRLLDSLRYPEINARFNGIKDSHYATFRWIFQHDPAPVSIPTEDIIGPPAMTKDQAQSEGPDLSGLNARSKQMDNSVNEINSFTPPSYRSIESNRRRTDAATRLNTWLCQKRNSPRGTDTFLIQGKAGSGKSTLMKFIFQHRRTTESLRQAANDEGVIMLFHSFWLVGTKLQNSYKGFLASLIHQLLTQRPSLLEACQTIRDYQHKCTLNDWSEQDLCSLLLAQVKQTRELVCLFVDGIDEYDSDDDLDRLVTLFEQLRSSPSGCRLCVSSRPIHHILRSFRVAPGLRLQDLTYKDIEQYVQLELEKKAAFLRYEDDHKQKIRAIGDAIAHRADGVFLWAHYVLRNVCSGLLIDDDLHALEKRIKILPSAIKDLYRFMWDLQHSNNQIHGNEAAQLFSFGDFFPTSVFQLMVAMDSTLQRHYLTHASTIDEARLDILCAAFVERLSIRSAGLIESVSVSEDILQYCYPPFIDRYITVQEFKPALSPGIACKWRCLRVQYFHRSVHDFLTGTEEGRQVTGHDQGLSLSAANEAYCIAFLASFVEGIKRLTLSALHDLSSLLEDNAAKLRLLDQCQKVCRQLWQGCSHSQIQETYGWVQYLQKYQREGNIANPCELDETGLMLAMNHLAGNTERLFSMQDCGLSAYYKGYLALCLIEAYDPVRWTYEKLFSFYESIASWIDACGADVVTPHTFLISDIRLVQRGPILQILARCLDFLLLYDAKDHTSRAAHCSLVLLSSLGKYAPYFKSHDLSFMIRSDVFTGKPHYDYTDDDRYHVYLYVIITFNAYDILQTLMSHYKHCSQAGERIPCIRTSRSSTSSLDCGLWLQCMALKYRLSVLKHAFTEISPVESTNLSEHEHQSIRRVLSSMVYKPTGSLDDAVCGETIELLKDSTWTSQLPDIQDVHFLRNKQRPEMVPLDPTAEATPQNWKKVCSLRHYFAELEKKEGLSQSQPEGSSITPASGISSMPAASNASDLQKEETNTSRSKPSKRFLRKFVNLGKRKE